MLRTAAELSFLPVSSQSQLEIEAASQPAMAAIENIFDSLESTIKVEPEEFQTTTHVETLRSRAGM